jgi:hypothetical protein
MEAVRSSETSAITRATLRRPRRHNSSNNIYVLNEIWKVYMLKRRLCFSRNM